MLYTIIYIIAYIYDERMDRKTKFALEQKWNKLQRYRDTNELKLPLTQLSITG